MSPVPHLHGLREVADRYDCFFLDIFGLLHNGRRLNPGTLLCLEALKNHGKKICLVSNTPKSASDCAQDLIRYGIEPSMYDHIVTGGESARVELEAHHKNSRVLFFGSIEFAGPMKGLDIVQARHIEEADFILNSIPGVYEVDEAELLALFHEAKTRDLKMICANPDLVVHIGDVLHTCAGTYAALYEQIGGEVSYHGKPYSQVYEMAREAMSMPEKSRICALGDALHTDIRGANHFGIDSIWALTGIHWEELRYEHQPDDPDPMRVLQALEKSSFKPNATMTDFKW